MEDEYKDSQNKRAARICGYRAGHQSLFGPCELGYACPLCGCANEELSWSEYKYFLYCYVCNRDIPSALCVKYPRPRLNKEPLDTRAMIGQATDVFLDTMESAKKRVFVDSEDKKRHMDIRRRI